REPERARGRWAGASRSGARRSRRGAGRARALRSTCPPVRTFRSHRCLTERMESDEALYARVKRGDMRAFDELYARHATRLFGFLRGQLATPADAEDVMHEAILATLESDEVTFDRGSFRTWLYRIARNRILNRARSMGRGKGALVKMSVEPERPPGADERIAREELLVALEGAVKR